MAASAHAAQANLQGDKSYGLHALTTKYESRDRLRLRCSTIVSSFGRPVVEKIQVEDAIPENNSFVYYFNQSPMCDYMVHFLEKLKALDSLDKMDKVLENFSVLQVRAGPGRDEGKDAWDGEERRAAGADSGGRRVASATAAYARRR